MTCNIIIIPECEDWGPKLFTYTLQALGFSAHEDYKLSALYPDGALQSAVWNDVHYVH